MYRNIEGRCRSGSRHRAVTQAAFSPFDLRPVATRPPAQAILWIEVDGPGLDAANGGRRFGLTDLADQSMRLAGPWRDGGIAEHAVEFTLRDVVAFAGALLQRF